MGGFLATFLMCAVGITVFLFFGLGLFYNFWGIVAVAAFLMALVITSFSELWKKTEELEGRIQELEEEEKEGRRRESRGGRISGENRGRKVSGGSRRVESVGGSRMNKTSERSRRDSRHRIGRRDSEENRRRQ